MLINIFLIILFDCLLLKVIFLNNLFIYINYKYNSFVYLFWSIFSLFNSSGILLFNYAFVIGTSGKIFSSILSIYITSVFIDRLILIFSA
jgi:hypothetical protein